MKEFSVVVKSETGLHARPASQFVSEASKFSSEIYLTKGETRVNAKSIMGVLGLGVLTGDLINVIAQGNDEEEAILSIKKLFDGGL